MTNTLSRANSLLLLVLETVHEENVSFVDLSPEVLGVTEQLLEVHGILIQKHTSDSWSVLFAISLLDHSINVVSNEVVPVWSTQLIQLRHIDRWK